VVETSKSPNLRALVRKAKYQPPQVYQVPVAQVPSEKREIYYRLNRWGQQISELRNMLAPESKVLRTSLGNVTPLASVEEVGAPALCYLLQRE
jgi:hypothetical protein